MTRPFLSAKGVACETIIAISPQVTWGGARGEGVG